MLRPPRALTVRRFLVPFVVLAGAVALYSYTQGNVFAPAFALLDAAIVGAALGLAARRALRGDRDGCAYGPGARRDRA